MVRTLSGPADTMTGFAAIIRISNSTLNPEIWSLPCSSGRYAAGIRLLVPMPERILKKIFAEAREPSIEALNGLVKNLPAVTRKWKHLLQATDLDPHGLKILGNLDLEAGFRQLRGSSYESIRSRLENLAEELAAADIGIEDTLAAFYLLFEQVLSSLRNQSDAIPAARISGITAALLAAGYGEYWEASQNALATRLADARQRLHGASAYVTQVYEGERRQLSHDLHDEIGHDLMLLKLYLELMLQDAEKLKPNQVKTKVAEALDVVRHAIESTRRLVLDLGPPIFDELGFVPAIRSYVREFSNRSGIKVTLQEGPLPEKIPTTHQVAVYRVLQGALGNVLKHGQAKRVKVKLGSIRNAVLVLTVEDDGIGFDIATARRPNSVGLISMRERVEVLGGRFQIESIQTGSLKRRSGTKIEIDLPLPKSQGSVQTAHNSRRA